jgi:hypothetical protein
MKKSKRNGKARGMEKQEEWKSKRNGKARGMEKQEEDNKDDDRKDTFIILVNRYKYINLHPDPLMS